MVVTEHESILRGLQSLPGHGRCLLVGRSVFGNDFDPAEEDLYDYLADDDDSDDGSPEEIYAPGVRSIQIGAMLRS